MKNLARFIRRSTPATAILALMLLLAIGASAHDHGHGHDHGHAHGHDHGHDHGDGHGHSHHHGGGHDDEVLARLFVFDASKNRVIYVDVPEFHVSGELALENPRGAAVTPDGRYIVMTSRGSDFVTVASTGLLLEWHDDHWDRVAVAPRVHRRFVAGSNPAHIRTLHDGRIGIANDGDDTVSIIDAQTGVVIKLPAGADHASLTVFPDPELLYAADITNGLIDVVDLHTFERVTTTRIGPRPHGAAHSVELGTVYFPARDGIWELSATGDHPGDVLRRLAISQNPDATTGYIEVHRHGKWIYGLIGATNQLFALDLVSGDVTHVNLASRPRAFAFDPRERFVAVALLDRPVVQLIGVDDHRPGYHRVQKSIDLSSVIGNEGLRGIAVTPDGEHIIVTGGEYVIALDDHGDLVSALDVHGEPGAIYIAALPADAEGHGDSHGHGHDHDHGHDHGHGPGTGIATNR